MAAKRVHAPFLTMENQQPAFGKIAWQDLIGFMSEDLIVQALADKERGKVDPAAWEASLGLAQQRAANAFGSGIVPEEFSNAVRYAMRVFLAEILFVRRGFFGEKNPYSAQAREQEKRLHELAGGDALAEEGGGTAITEPMKTTARGNMI